MNWTVLFWIVVVATVWQILVEWGKKHERDVAKEVVRDLQESIDRVRKESEELGLRGNEAYSVHWTYSVLPQFARAGTSAVAMLPCTVVIQHEPTEKFPVGQTQNSGHMLVVRRPLRGGVWQGTGHCFTGDLSDPEVRAWVEKGLGPLEAMSNASWVVPSLEDVEMGTLLDSRDRRRKLTFGRSLDELSVDELLDLASMQHWAGENAKAVETLDAGLRREPGDSALLVSKAGYLWNVCVRIDDLMRLIPFYDECIQVNAECRPVWHVRKAEVFALEGAEYDRDADGDYIPRITKPRYMDDALTELEKAFALDPTIRRTVEEQGWLGEGWDGTFLPVKDHPRYKAVMALEPPPEP